MFEKVKMKKAIARADRILVQRNKLMRVIGNEVSELGPLIVARLDGEAAAAAAAADAALAETDSDTAIGSPLPRPGARDRQAEVGMWGERLQRQDLKLRGLRSLLYQQGSELAAAHEELRLELPAFENDIRAQFATEWAAGILTLEKLLSRRLALESFIGKLDELPAVPQRATVAADLGDAMFAPHEVLRKLNDAISEITGWASMAQSVLPPHPSLGVAAAYDPKGVYELVRPFDGLEAQTKVVDSTFHAGILEWLVRGWDAVPVRADSAVLLHIQRAQRQIEGAASQRPEPNAPPMSEEALAKGREAHAFNRRDSAEADPARSHHATMNVG
jgi:hypothetical protein